MCDNLKTFETKSDPCNISECIESVTGLKSNSSSRTDTMILKFKPNVKYEDSNVAAGFMKLWIMVDDNSAIEDIYVTKEASMALQYETEMYRDIIRPLVDNKICPNFVKYLTSAYACSIEDMKNILLTSLADPDTNLLRSLAYVSGVHEPEEHEYDERGFRLRPSITDPSRYPAERLKLIKDIIEDEDWKISYLVTEAEPANTPDLAKWISQRPPLDELWPVFFQVACAIYAMQCAKVTHNDLHTGNVWVEKLEEPKTVMYVYNDTCYTLEIKYMAKVYDFDRSYSERLGFNAMIGDANSRCKRLLQCNELNINTDIDKVYDQALENMREVYSSNEVDEVSYVVKQDSIELIMSSLAARSNADSSTEEFRQQIDSSDVYVCRPSFFNSDGTLHKRYKKMYEGGLYLCKPEIYEPPVTRAATKRRHGEEIKEEIEEENIPESDTENLIESDTENLIESDTENLPDIDRDIQEKEERKKGRWWLMGW